MRRVLIALVALTVIAVAVWRLWPSSSSSASESTAPVAAATQPAAGSSVEPETAPPKHVTRIPTPEDRRRIAEQIARARASHASAASSSGSTPPPTLEPTAISKESIRDAMKEVQQQLTDCYAAALPTLARKDFDVKAHFTLTGDPDVGTLIDTQEIVDDLGKPLDPKFDDCMRGTLMSLELPPLAEGDEVRVVYPFAFSHGD